jgi:hypothetical protein
MREKCKVNSAVGAGRDGRAQSLLFSYAGGKGQGSGVRGGIDIKEGRSPVDLKPLSRQQVGQAFPGYTPGAAAPFDPGDPAITHHSIDSAAGEN